MTAQWVVYVEQSIADELKSVNINQFEPSNVPITFDKNHPYGSLIPQDVKDNLLKQNAALTKEIEDRRNQKIIQQIKDEYHNKVIIYQEFLKGTPEQNRFLTSFA